MDLHLDTSWCPVCDRQILPKRFLIPVIPPAPAPPPSSPSSSSPTKNNTHDAPAVRRTKNGAARPRPGGLVHGTGRVKPNGAIKPLDSPTKLHNPIPVPAPPVKLRTVIDQGPIPLYCSDECQMADMTHAHAGFAHDFDPNRSSPPIPPAPHNSFSGPTSFSESDSDSSGSSGDSCYSDSQYASVSPSIAILAAMYNFPPLPPPPPVFDDCTVTPEFENPNNYQSGVMMAGKRLREALCPERPKRSVYATNNYPTEPRKPIPGWTDGSTAWRSALYSFSAPTDLSNADPSQTENSSKAYKSFAASPHRSHGVYSTLSDSGRVPVSCNSGCTASFPPNHCSETEELYFKYSQSLSRRSESRASLFPSTSPTSPSSIAASHRRERPLLKPGAEGKLLVPNVMMRVHGRASPSISSGCGGSSYPGASRRSSLIKSPLSRGSDEDLSTASMVATSSSVPKRPVVETRSWSYDNLKTYPVMPLPPKKEKRIEQQVVDGQTVDVEVEVEVVQPMKRLFLFPGKEVRVERR